MARKTKTEILQEYADRAGLNLQIYWAFAGEYGFYARDPSSSCGFRRIGCDAWEAFKKLEHMSSTR